MLYLLTSAFDSIAMLAKHLSLRQADSILAAASRWAPNSVIGFLSISKGLGFQIFALIQLPLRPFLLRQ